MGHASTVRTSIMLREDLFQRLKRGQRGLSETINQALDAFLEAADDVFGALPAESFDYSDVREKEDRV